MIDAEQLRIDMPITTDRNPGKYDAECTILRESTKARGAIAIVFEGTKGNGFSIQADLLTLLRLPEILRNVADDIEKDTADINGM
jgi:hypothetical protein